MSKFELSNYQKDILKEVHNSNSGNFLIDAKAGSGKTSTLLLIAEEIIKQNKKCLFLAFNKSITEELQTRIVSENVCVKTLHSLGFSFISSYLWRKHQNNYRLEVDSDDSFTKETVIQYFDEYCWDSFIKSSNVEDLDEANVKDTYNQIIREISSMVNYVRLYNVNSADKEAVKELGKKLCWNLKEYESYGLEDYPKIITKVLEKIKNNFENPEINFEGLPQYNVTFTDMIYFPCYYRMYPSWSVKPYLDYILCDECQDLSVLQQLFLKLLIDQNLSRNNKFIFVGDEKQAIYGFAGADTNSINNLKKNFNLKELPLNICYRCPENIIKIAQQMVPSIDWNHKREDKGIVKFTKEDRLKDEVKCGDIIVGRRNKDLLRIYKDFTFKYKQPIKFKNEQMVSTIINEIKRVIKEYIKRYNQGLNVEKRLYEELLVNNIDISKPLRDLDKSKLDLKEKMYAKLVKQNQATLSGKNIVKRNYTTSYLKQCMMEYKNVGGYLFTTQDTAESIYSDYFDIIYQFLEEHLLIKDNSKLDDFLNYLEEFLQGSLVKNAPVLSSIHMMKGGEADNVFILDYPRFPYIYNSQTDDAKQQEVNLQYVALTRPKKNLYLCEITQPRPGETEEDILTKNVECVKGVKLLLD